MKVIVIGATETIGTAVSSALELKSGMWIDHAHLNVEWPR